MRLLATALVALALTGCEREYAYTLNPDGSGRVELVWRMPGTGHRGRQNAEAQITRAKKIDAWASVTFERGTSTFRATGYFKDVNADPLPGMNNFSVRLRDNADGTKTLLVRHPRQHDYRPRRAMTEAQVRERIAKVRGDYLKQLQDPENEKHRKGRHTFVIDPPGKVRTAVNMKVRADGKLEVVYDAAAIQDALGKILADERKVREFVTAGESLIKCGDTFTAMINERVFGIRAQVQAVLEGPFEQKFDYAAAVGAAESDRGKIIRAAGFVPNPLPKADGPDSLRDLKVLRATQRGAALGVVFRGTLPKPAKYSDGFEFYRVIDDRGRTLLPGSGARRYGSGALEDGGATVELRLGLPRAPVDVRRLKEVVGVYRYRALGPLFAEPLGRVTPKAGVMIAKHSFVITHYKRDPRKGTIEINWQAEAPPRLARVVLLDGRKEFLRYDIEPEPVKRRIVRPFKILDPKVKPPRTLDVVFYTTTKIEHIEAPFVLRDVSFAETK